MQSVETWLLIRWISNTPPVSVNELVERLQLKESTIVVGYIGSLRALEGVDYTAKAVANCVNDGLDIASCMQF